MPDPPASYCYVILQRESLRVKLSQTAWTHLKVTMSRNTISPARTRANISVYSALVSMPVRHCVCF